VSGVVEALGDGVEGWAVGDEVCALLAGGGYAEYVRVPAGQLLPVPRGVSLVDAAALPEVVCTVWSNVFLTANLQPGELLLVHGGSSGIGTMAIQLAVAVGARVAVTAGSPEKLEACRALGAEVLVNYREEDFVERVRAATDGEGANVVLDNMGAKYLGRNVEVLAVNGRLVVIGLQGGRTGELDLGMLLAKRGAVIDLAARAAGRREGDHRRGGARARLAAGRGRCGAPRRALAPPAGRRRGGAPRARGERAHRQDPPDHGVTARAGIR
jgi:NADPH:quinone reductase-like Zn-dependent oxidoreductase